MGSEVIPTVAPPPVTQVTDSMLVIMQEMVDSMSRLFLDILTKTDILPIMLMMYAINLSVDVYCTAVGVKTRRRRR